MRFWSRVVGALTGASMIASAGVDQPKIVADAVGAANWMSKALSSSGYKADFSLNSLREVDRFFDEQAADGQATPGGLLSEQLGQRIFGLGAYVGEVIRRDCNGAWQGNDADPKAEINIEVKLKDGTVFWPVQRVMKRFKNGSEDGIYAYGSVLVENCSKKA